MRKESWIGCFVLFMCVLFISCSENLISDQSGDSIEQKSMKSLAEYVTVEDLKWVLNISAEEASKLGFSQKDYEESIREIAGMNKSLEELKKDTNTIIHLILPTEQIVIDKGKVEYISNAKTKANHCSNINLVTSIEVPANSTKYTSFVTEVSEYKVCIEGQINPSPRSSWELRIDEDIWNVKRVVMGSSRESSFQLEWSMGGTGYPVTFLEWKYFLNFVTFGSDNSPICNVSFYILRN